LKKKQKKTDHANAAKLMPLNSVPFSGICALPSQSYQIIALAAQHIPSLFSSGPPPGFMAIKRINQA